MWKINRIEPRMPVGAYQTYRLARPLDTHWRPATCAEVGCPAHVYGWATTVAAGSDDEALVRRSGRSYTAEHLEGGFVRFTFRAGQRCFAAAAHRRPVERPPLCVVRGGDWRSHLGTIRDHGHRTDLWVEDFAEHQQHIADHIQRG